MQVGQNAMTSVLLRGTQRRGGGHVTTEADTGAVRPQGKETWKHRKLGEVRNRLSPGGFGESTALLIS